MTDLTPEQIEQAAADVCNEIAPILDKFPMGVAMAVGMQVIGACLRILVNTGNQEGALSVADYMMNELQGWKDDLNGQEEIPASTEATA